MTFRDLSDPHAIQRALGEFDEVGREAFLAKYGFSEARAYFVEQGGKRYDSRAIAAAAHAYQFGVPLLPSDFSGGDATVAAKLERLGYEVTRRFSPPDWTTDELILALDLYLTGGGVASWSKTSRDVVELSQLLRSLPVFAPGIRDHPTFRNPAGVALKISNFAAIDPDHPGAGMAHGSQSDRLVWDQWAHRPDELRDVALAIRTVGSQAEVESETDEAEEASAEEGRLLYRLHRRRERNRALVKKKKQAARQATGRLACEVCDFESSEIYGDGVEVIDVHHVVPLHKVGETRTSLADLALVCPTCHRVLHAHTPFITPTELRAKREGTTAAAVGTG